MSCGTLSQVLTAALKVQSSQSRYFLLATASTNWCIMAGTWLVLSMYRRCWGLRGAEERFLTPSASLPAATSACILMGDRGTLRYCCTSVTDTAGIGFPNTDRWGHGLAVHIFLLPSTSFRSEADLPSNPASSREVIPSLASRHFRKKKSPSWKRSSKPSGTSKSSKTVWKVWNA